MACSSLGSLFIVEMGIPLVEIRESAGGRDVLWGGLCPRGTVVYSYKECRRGIPDDDGGVSRSGFKYPL